MNKAGIVPGGRPATPAQRKSRKANLQRRPLFLVARFGSGKTELYWTVIGASLAAYNAG